MNVSASARRLTLLLHIVSSVGWLGAVLVFLALGSIALTAADAQTVRSVYVLMEPVAWWVLVPLSVASLVTGLGLSLLTSWGLLRHYWVVFKLVLNAFATLVLLEYMETFRGMALVAADGSADLDAVRNPSPVIHSVLALLTLVVATVLAVYKPRGVTPVGAAR